MSAVLPAYNAERFLKDALDSVLRQSHPCFEILVVNDGSTDETGRLAESVPGVRCIHQPNSGVSSARNRGIRESSGTFIALLDADDAWDPDKIATQLAGLQRGQFAYSARIETDASLKPIRVVRGDRRWPLLEGLLFHGNVVGTPSSVIAPRDALLQAGGFDENLSMCADWDMWIRLAQRLFGVYSEKTLVQYRVHAASMSTDIRRFERDSMYMLKKAFSSGLPDDLEGRRSEAESRMWEVLGGCYWNDGNVRDAFRCVVHSILQRPSRLRALAASVPYRAFRRAKDRWR